MERFVIIVNGWKPLTIITKHFILDNAEVLALPLMRNEYYNGINPFHENIRKLLIFWCFQEVLKETSGMKKLNDLNVVLFLKFK